VTHTVYLAREHSTLPHCTSQGGMMGLLNIPELLGCRQEMQVMKRAGDRLDAILALILAILGILLYSASYSGPRLSCVPVDCPASPLSPKCSLDWSYQSHLCEEELLSYPDASFHLLLLMKGALFLSVLILPIFYGNPACTDQFTGISGLWRLRSNAPVTGQLEWRRKMVLVLEQLKSSTLLTRHYSLYHTLGLTLDSISLLISLLYSLHFLDYHLPPPTYSGLWTQFEGQDLLGISAFFHPGNTLCQNGTFHCEMPNLTMYKWFGGLGSILLASKVINRWLCLGFSLGIPGLFGRNVLLHCSRLTDVNSEPVYNLESRPLPALLAVLANIASLLLLSPIRSMGSFLNFYFYNSECKTAITLSAEDEGSLDDLDTREEAFLAAATAATSPPSLGQGRGDSRGRHFHPQLQNWCDLFFVMDVMSGSIDICEILVFISKLDPLVEEMEGKRVDVGKSFLDTYNHTLTLVFTSAGSLEQLLDQEVEGGTEVRGWLEGHRGRVEAQPQEDGKALVFPVDFGTSYELVSAVFGRGRQLVRLQPFRISVPGEIRIKLSRRPGHEVPLSMLGLDPRPL